MEGERGEREAIERASGVMSGREKKRVSCEKGGPGRGGKREGRRACNGKFKKEKPDDF